MPSIGDYLFGNPYQTMVDQTQQELATRRATQLNPSTQAFPDQEQAHPDSPAAYGRWPGLGGRFPYARTQ